MTEPSCIQPWPSNPFYWEYGDEPVLLLGATSTDKFFQLLPPAQKEELTLLAGAGGNYIRNTMSARQPIKAEAGVVGDRMNVEQAFKQLPGGVYDLKRWNEVYWEKFEHMLGMAESLGIIVGIEVFDRFDFYNLPNWDEAPWHQNPYRPANNINYTTAESGLGDEYPYLPSTNLQPFFYTVPALDNNRVVLQYQQAFVNKMVLHTIERSNVIFIIRNETHGAPEFSKYWADYIRGKCSASGKSVYITEMWEGHDITDEMHLNTLDHPETYDFNEISQGTAEIQDQEHWDNIQRVRQCLIDQGRPWPMNATKIYGADGSPWGDWIDDNWALKRFWRHIIGGAAVSRFHRPPWGMGLNTGARNAIKAVRLIESRVKMWELVPRQDLLTDRARDEAYLAANPGESYVLYFSAGRGDGSVGLQLSDYPYPFELRWLATLDGEWNGSPVKLDGGKTVTISAPSLRAHWVAVIEKAR